MDPLDKIQETLRLLAESHAEADRQRVKDKAESDRQRAKDKAESDRQRAKDKAEFDRKHAKDMAIADKRAAEADKRAAEADKREAKADKREAKAEEERAELRAILKRNDVLIGRLDNRFGNLAEAMLVGDVVETLRTVDGLDLNYSSYSVQRLNDDNNIECEIDALLVGKNSIVVMEAKSTLTTDKIEKFIDSRLNRFTELFPVFANWKIYGAVGYLKAVEDAVEVAIREGLLVVRSTLQAKEVVNPQPFKPKDYNPRTIKTRKL